MSKLRVSILLIFAALQISCSSMLYHPSQHIYYDPKKLGISPQEVNFKSSDGTKLHGWYFANKKLKAKALIVFYHGNAQNISSHYLALIPLLEFGYDFFIFDYHGYGKSEGKPSPAATVADGEAALLWAHKNYPNLPIVIFAQSLGSVIALKNSIDLKEKVPLRFIIIDSGFTSYQSIARKVLARSWITWPFQWLSYITLSDRYAPGEDIAKISPIPLLVIHGSNDAIIPFSAGEKLFSLAKEPKTFWKIDDGRHTDALSRKNIQLDLIACLNLYFDPPGQKPSHSSTLPICPK